MSLVAVKNGFYDVDGILLPFERNYPITNNIQQTLSKITGFDANNALNRLLVCDSDGRLLVSLSPTQTSTGNISQLVMDGTTQGALAANPSRKLLTIANRGAAIIKMSFVSPVGASNFFTIPVGGVYSNDRYLGTIFLTGTIADIAEIIEI